MKSIKDAIKGKSLFIDTAPIIYYIEAHSQFGPLVKILIETIQNEKLLAFTSVLTITEVLPKPIQLGKTDLATMFCDFLKRGKHLCLVDINTVIAENAGKLRGKYPALKAFDVIQISAAMYCNADVFITNDMNLKQVSDIDILVLKDYIL